MGTGPQYHKRVVVLVACAGLHGVLCKLYTKQNMTKFPMHSPPYPSLPSPKVAREVPHDASCIAIHGDYERGEPAVRYR